MAQSNGLFQKVVNLCKRRGFIHQSAELVGGLKGCYDYGPLGVELKRNIANEWYGATTKKGNGLEGKAMQGRYDYTAQKNHRPYMRCLCYIYIA
jgi:glycyl-tRNA synthetase (class II)